MDISRNFDVESDVQFILYDAPQEMLIIGDEDNTLCRVSGVGEEHLINLMGDYFLLTNPFQERFSQLPPNCRERIQKIYLQLHQVFAQV